MKKKFPLIVYMIPALLIACFALVLMTGAMDAVGIFEDPTRLWQRIILPLMRLALFISIGLFVGQFIKGMGWTDRLSVMARPFIAAPVRALRHQMPYYMGIFNPGLGLRLMIASQVFRISSLVSSARSTFL